MPAAPLFELLKATDVVEIFLFFLDSLGRADVNASPAFAAVPI
jgi:hypothetical protein